MIRAFASAVRPMPRSRAASAVSRRSILAYLALTSPLSGASIIGEFVVAAFAVHFGV